MKDSAMKIFQSATFRLFMIFLVAFIAAFLPRAYRLEDIHYKFDEWLGTLQPGPAIEWSRGPAAVLTQLFETARYYVTSTMTITTCFLTQVLKLITGPDPAALRWWFISFASLGVGTTAVISDRLFPRWGKWPVIVMGAFSVCAIVFSQFANNFAFTYLMTAAQIAVYLFRVRDNWRWPGFLFFSVTAYLCQLIMYTQLLVTAGIFLAALIEISFRRRSWRLYLTWCMGGLTYLAISFIHFFATFSKIPWDEPFRMYMASYYPLFLLNKAAPLSGWDGSWWGYYLLRLYDLFNYHWSLVFNPRIYQPQQWNWVSLPFLAVLAGGLGSGLILWRKRKVNESNQLSVISNQSLEASNQLSVISNQGGKDSDQSFEDSHQLSVISNQSLEASNQLSVISNHSWTQNHRQPATSNQQPATGVIPLIFCSILGVHMVANRFLLITFGGTRQCVYMAPVFWLFYGWLGVSIVRLIGPGRKFFRRLMIPMLMLLPLVPFLFSLPGLYRDRVGRLDLDLLMEAVSLYQPDRILAPRDSIQGLQLTLISDPRFEDVHWPGYPYESDMLDADPLHDQPKISFLYQGKEYLVYLSTPENYPSAAENLLYLDLYMSGDGRFEDRQLRQFYTPLRTMLGERQRIVPLAEKPGNAPRAIHQSIYWPPNSFYMYRIVKEHESR